MSSTILASIAEAATQRARASELARQSSTARYRADKIEREAEDRERDADTAVRRLSDLLAAQLATFRGFTMDETPEGTLHQALFAAVQIHRCKGVSGVSFRLFLTVNVAGRQSFPQLPEQRNQHAAHKAAVKALTPYTADGYLEARGADKMDPREVAKLIQVVPVFKYGPGPALQPAWEIRVGGITLVTRLIASPRHWELVKPLVTIKTVDEANLAASAPRFTDPVRAAWIEEITRFRVVQSGNTVGQEGGLT